MQLVYHRSQLYMQAQHTFVSRHITYFSVQTLVIGFLVVFYGVQAFSESPTCMSGTTSDITSVTYKMKKIFRTCFFAHTFEFINSAFVGPYFQVLVPT